MIAHAEPLAVIHQGDCIEVMAEMAEASIDAIVCDPPYGLKFMGKEWDRTVPHEWVPAAYRVLKPGGHLVAFGGTRTFHRLTCALEDAGFEIRDCLMWLYGSGFPKSLDVSKAIDKAAGVWRGRAGAVTSSNAAMAGPNYARADKGEPAIAEARSWDGWGTALKPAWEPIILARKPLAERNVAANVLAHGTGAINVDGCRVGSEQRFNPFKGKPPEGWGHSRNGQSGGTEALGRWPANLVLDEAAAALLDEQSGELTSGGTPFRRGGMGYHGAAGQESVSGNHGDTGGASRFFKVTKWTDDDASDAGPSSCPPSGPDASALNPAQAPTTPTCCVSCGSVLRVTDEPTRQDGAGRAAGVSVRVAGTRFHYDAKADADDRDGSKHPTVKPVDLMKWLIRLVTPPEGIVLDPFLGSGTTVYAARALGVRSIGIEREADYVQEAIWRLRQGVLL